MNFTRNLKNFKLLRNLSVLINKGIYFKNEQLIHTSKTTIAIYHKHNQKYLFTPFFVAGIFFTSDSKEEETPEQQLITIIKRSILCIQKGEYKKAEQMLHLALKVAQEFKLNDGITYVYDVMANLAMEQEQFDKAEKLYVEVMKRLFQDGYDQDNIKVLHINSKISHMSQLKGEFEKAKQGFLWTIEKIENKLKLLPDDKELQELYGITKNWFAQLLMDNGKYEEAKTLFKEAYEILTKEYGKFNQEAILILNNLSVACTNLNNNAEAKKYLEEALNLAKKLPDMVEVGVLQANLGLLYLQDNLIKEAKELCSTAYRYGKKENNLQVIEQAEYCLDQIKKATTK